MPSSAHRPAPAGPSAPVESYPFHLDLAPLRETVRVRARAAGLPPHKVVDLVLAVGEASANTVRHAGGAGTLRIWQNEAEFVCEISDAGCMADPRAGQLPPPAGTRGGQGLWIIHQACDRVEVRSGDAGTVVRMHMRRDGDEAIGRLCAGPLATSHVGEEPGAGSPFKIFDF
jgi:anti-sigma regulatory factor (Ser/Thr protein kinase)